jgi:hypothetical protein
MTPRGRILRWSLPVLLGAACRELQAQRVPAPEAPQIFKLHVGETYLQTDVDVDREVQTAGDGASSVMRQRVMVQPVVGLGLDGSVYHPNFVHCSFAPELGLDWQDVRAEPGGSASESHFLQRYHGTVDILRFKPYATSLFADKDVTYRDYDFFSRVRVDSERYGVRSGFTDGPVPFTASVQHYAEVTSDLLRPTALREDTVTLNAHQSRRGSRADTALSYYLNDYFRMDDGYSEQHGLQQNLGLTDSESFGTDDWIRWLSSLNVNTIRNTSVPTTKVLLQEKLNLQHSAKLRSFYEYTYDYAATGDSESRTHQGRVGASHQLYENLTSTLDVHGTLVRSTAPESFSDTARFGVAIDEQYARSLGTWGRLTLGYAGGIDREERSTGGGVLQITDEVHVLANGVVTFLNQPQVDASSIDVTDPSGTIAYQLGRDYLVLPRGDLTQIQRVDGGHIPDPGTVLVDYRATLEPSDAFTAFANAVNVRLDLWEGILGIYFRWNLVDYDDGETLLLRTLNEKTFGVDSTWKWFRAGAEYGIVDSNLSPYTRMRLFESAHFAPSPSTDASLDLDQSWMHYPDNDLREQMYGAIARFRDQLTPHLAWSVEGGVRLDRGTTFDRTISAVRTGLDWSVGRLTVRIGYEYSRQYHLTDGQERHHLFVRLRRTF